jgi:dihydrofolate synthase/folylpolyglutamate synthase
MSSKSLYNVREYMKSIDYEYKDALRFLYSLQKYGIKFGLSKTENLLKAMGNPEKGLKFVHIAGTNGKGSVAAYLNSVLQEAGYRVGLYTSPHLVSFQERMKICSRAISRQDVVRLTNEIKKIMIKKEPPTFFEAITAMAFKYFADMRVDIVILETGMGGRLDATNVITPEFSIITNISLEHQEFLGSTLLDIAREKAGIIKPYLPLITGVTQSEVVTLFEDICNRINSDIYRIYKDFQMEYKGGLYNYYGIKKDYLALKSGLCGRFQKNNLALSLAGVEILNDKGFKISDDAVKKGISHAFWPGRMHFISDNPRILLDGAHNVDAMLSLKNSLKDLEFKRLILVIGVLGDKDVKNILKIIVPEADFIIYTRPVYFRALEPDELKNQYSPQGEYLIVPNLKEAIYVAREKAKEGDLILITGSLFTVGEALSIIDPENYPLEEI